MSTQTPNPRKSVQLKAETNVRWLEEQFVEKKWYPQEFKPKTDHCPNITRSMKLIVESLLARNVPLSILWKKGGLFRLAIKQLSKRGTPRLTADVVNSVLGVVKEKFGIESQETWRVEEDKTNYTRYEMVIGKHDRTGVINPDGRELGKLVFPRPPKTPKKPSNLGDGSDSGSEDLEDDQVGETVEDSQAVPDNQGDHGDGDGQGDEDKACQGDEDGDASGGKQEQDDFDSGESNRRDSLSLHDLGDNTLPPPNPEEEIDLTGEPEPEPEPEPNGPLESSIPGRLPTPETLRKEGVMLSSTDIDDCMKPHPASKGWRSFAAGFPAPDRDNTISSPVPLNLVFIMNKEYHWYVVHLDVASRHINVYDSMPNQGRNNWTLSCIKHWATENASRIGSGTLGESHFEGLELNHKECAQQEDGVNCGIFAVEFAVALIEGRPVPLELDVRFSRMRHADMVERYDRLLEHGPVRVNSATSPPLASRKRRRRISSTSLSSIRSQEPKRVCTQSFQDDVNEIETLAKTLDTLEADLENAETRLAEQEKLRKDLEKAISSIDNELAMASVESNLLDYGMSANIITGPIADGETRKSQLKERLERRHNFAKMLEAVKKEERELGQQVEKLRGSLEWKKEERKEKLKDLTERLKP